MQKELNRLWLLLKWLFHPKTNHLRFVGFAYVLTLLFVLSLDGGSVGVQSSGDTRLLVLGAQNGSIRDVSRALRNGANINEIVKVNGNEELSPLMAACRSGDLGIVQLLMKNGAQVNLRNSLGETALIIAGTKGDIKTVRFLLQHGASAESQDHTGRNAAIRAAELGYFSVVQELTRTQSPPGLQTAMLIGAAREGNIAVVNEAIRNGANVDREAYGGGTALMAAAQNCKTESIKALIKAGANVNTRTIVDGETALYWARRGGCVEGMKLLLEAGCDPNTKDTMLGWTPLMWAANDGQIDAVKLLLFMGSNPNVRSDSGSTALNLAKGAVGRGIASEDLVTILSEATHFK